MQSNHMERMHMWSSLKTYGCHPTWPSLLQKIENYCQFFFFKSGKKPVATKLYGNDAYMIHFQTYGC